MRGKYHMTKKKSTARMAVLMDTQTRNKIVNPIIGLIIFNPDIPQFEQWDGVKWSRLKK